MLFFFFFFTISNFFNIKLMALVLRIRYKSKRREDQIEEAKHGLTLMPCGLYIWLAARLSLYPPVWLITWRRVSTCRQNNTTQTKDRVRQYLHKTKTFVLRKGHPDIKRILATEKVIKCWMKCLCCRYQTKDTICSRTDEKINPCLQWNWQIMWMCDFREFNLMKNPNHKYTNYN